MRLFERLKQLDPRIKIFAGLACVVLGLLALVTPFTPGSWLVFVGLELLGFRILAWNRLVDWFRRKRAHDTQDTIDTQ